MPNLLNLKTLSSETIQSIIDKASYYQKQIISKKQKAHQLANTMVANLFLNLAHELLIHLS